MIKDIYFYRFDPTGDYHEFSLIHYISILSFHIHHPSSTIHLLVDGPLYSKWLVLLKDKLGDSLYIEQVDFKAITARDFSDFDNVPHAVDCFKINYLYHHPGVVVDTDMICMRNMDEWFGDKFTTSEERDPLSFHFCKLAIGIIGSNARMNSVVGELADAYVKYEKGKDWTYYSGDVMTEIWKKDKSRFTIIPDEYVNPFTYTRSRLADLFLHNHDIGPCFAFHVSESICWDRYLKPLDLEHIMTVNTTFTKAVRPYVADLWNELINKPIFK